MRKRFVTTLLTCLLSFTCVFSFAACGDDNDDKNEELPVGEQVTEEEWRAAFEATINATNYTFSYNVSSVDTQNHTFEDGSVIDTYNRYTISKIVYLNSNKVYDSYTEKREETGRKELFGKDNTEYTNIFEYYAFMEGTDLWESDLSSKKYVSGAPEDFVGEEAVWEAEKSEYKNAEEAKEALLRNYVGNRHEIRNYGYISEKEGGRKRLIDLYSAFTYSDGKYSANLRRDHINVATVEVCIKDGYVIGFRQFRETEGSLYISQIPNYKEGYGKYEEEIMLIFKNYGKTTVKAPAGATKAINNAKAEK